ncbi:energy transducer TonB [Moraxella osloensis]|uniref:energy transducer TonB n=1 Tax=Faucicola osloensis TaxID=34062 RepID=UPI0020043141|nr:energy transducer TonB [Moraxella osloensis]MCK6051625.1 energy transducer TonB [Moraxella osloensis]
MLSTPSSDNKSSKLYIRVVVVGIVTALHGLLLYLFFQYQTPLKIKPQTTQPLEISFIQLKPHSSQTYHSQPPVAINHANPTKQAYTSTNTQAAGIKEKPFPTPNPTPAKPVNHPAKDNNHKPIELRPTRDNSTNQKKASQPKTSLSTASQIQTENQAKTLDIPSQPLLNAHENNAHYEQQQAAQIERNINLNNSQSLTQSKSATINQSHTNADNALKPITHDERAKSSAKSSKDSMRPQIQKTPNQPVSPVISAIPDVPAINSSAKPATPITFGNADASWQKRPNTQLPPNLSRIVTLKQLSSLQVKLNVNAKGDVEKCRITQTSGDPEVDKFICQQVQKAKLYPKKANGVTVPSIGNLTIALTNLAN